MKPAEIQVDYAMFRDFWKHLVSKRKARKFEVDRDEIWQRLASGRLGLREHPVGVVEATAEERATVTPSFDKAGRILKRSLKGCMPVVRE